MKDITTGEEVVWYFPHNHHFSVPEHNPQKCKTCKRLDRSLREYWTMRNAIEAAQWFKWDRAIIVKDGYINTKRGDASFGHLTPYEVGLLRRTARAIEGIDWSTLNKEDEV